MFIGVKQFPSVPTVVIEGMGGKKSENKKMWINL